MKKNIILLIFMALLFLPFSSSAAEVLQIRDSTNLQIGDRNRSYTVKLACVEVEPEKELSAISWLKSNLKRGKKVNIKPEGVINGSLLARVITIESKLELGNSLVENGLAKSTCDSA